MYKCILGSLAIALTEPASKRVMEATAVKIRDENMLARRGRLRKPLEVEVNLYTRREAVRRHCT